MKAKGYLKEFPLDAIKVDKKRAKRVGKKVGILEVKTCNKWVSDSKEEPDPETHCDGTIVEGENTVVFASSKVAPYPHRSKAGAYIICTPSSL